MGPAAMLVIVNSTPDHVIGLGMEVRIEAGVYSSFLRLARMEDINSLGFGTAIFSHDIRLREELKETAALVYDRIQFLLPFSQENPQ
jgi:hypothetical protein